MKSKITLVTAILIVILTMILIGCAPKPAAPTETTAAETKAVTETTTAEETKPGKPYEGITLKAALIGGANYEELYKAIPKFEEETGAKVEIVFKSSHFELHKKMMTDFAAGTVDYDIISSHSSFFSQYIKANGIIPLEDYFTEEELADHIPMILNSGMKDGHLWIIPRHFDISCLHYRTDIFNDAEMQKKFKDQTGKDLKVPETWDEFKETAIALQKILPAGVYATQFTGKEEALSGRFYEVLLAEGGQLLDENWKPAFNSSAGVKAITMFRDLYKASAMPPGMTGFVWEDVAKNWVTGNIAMYTEWYGWYGYFQDPSASKVAGKFDIARQPEGDGGIHSGWAGQHSFSITTASKNKEAAAALIKFLTNEEQQYSEAKLGFLVTRQSIWKKIIEEAKATGKPLDVKRLELAQLQASEDFKTPPLIAEWAPLSDILFPILQAIILGDKEPKTGLDEAANKVDQLMKDAGYYK
ncbi:MAG: sugar ABC transporter substrate-binding protein [Actinobacteria bacterium]|nr:sugar ABC transporter substrate-binding protein [Actinomycetota bacterium]